MQRALGTMLICLLVVLAGCNGVFGGDSEPTETLTPAAVPTDEPTPTPVPQLAPGVTGNGIKDVNALVAAHGSFLRNRSYTRRSNATGLAQNGSVLFRTMSTSRAGPANEGAYSISERSNSSGYSIVGYAPVHTEVWANRGRLFLKSTYANGTTTYDRFEQQYGYSGAGLRFQLEAFDTANTSVTERERNGTTLYLVRGSMQGNARNASLRLLVDSRGFIHSYRTVREGSFEANVSKVVSETRYTGVGETEAPERPSWVDEAMNRTTATRPVGTTTEG